MKSCYSNEISKFRCDGVISTTPRKPNNFYTIKWDEHQIEIAIKRFKLYQQDIQTVVDTSPNNRQLLRKAREAHNNKSATTHHPTSDPPSIRTSNQQSTTIFNNDDNRMSRLNDVRMNTYIPDTNEIEDDGKDSDALSTSSSDDEEDDKFASCNLENDRDACEFVIDDPLDSTNSIFSDCTNLKKKRRNNDEFNHKIRRKYR